MKVFLIIIFSIILSFRSLIPIADYVINYKYYSEVLCQNKEKPAMKCNGKCQLAKEMVKYVDDDNNQQEESKKLNIKILDLFVFFSIEEYSSKMFFNVINKKHISYLNLYSFCDYRVLKAPPKL